eukprot:6823976-Prorocentrum_lima.AAC.1
MCIRDRTSTIEPLTTSRTTASTNMLTITPCENASNTWEWCATTTSRTIGSTNMLLSWTCENAINTRAQNANWP